jgi:hypothetical protein
MKAFTSRLLALLGSPFLSTPSYLPPLPLKAPCTWGVATIGMEERALFVSCGSSRFRVYHPKSMYGLILLQNDDEALQFVRFFSSRYTAAMAGLAGRVEVRPMDEERGIDFYYADTKLFAGRFKRASVRSYDHCCPKQITTRNVNTEKSGRWPR